MLVYVSYVHRDLETAMSGKDTGSTPACACCCTHAMGVNVQKQRLGSPLAYDCACAGGFYGAIWKYAGIILIAAPLFAATDFVEMRLVLVRFWRVALYCLLFALLAFCKDRLLKAVLLVVVACVSNSMCGPGVEALADQRAHERLFCK